MSAASEAWCNADNAPPAATEAQDDIRQLDDNCPPASSLCHTKFRPLLLTGMLVQLLRNHYADPVNIEDPLFKTGDFAPIWRDGNSSGILIESVYRWSPGTAGKRPAVLLKRNKYTNLRFAISDRSQVDGVGDQHYVTAWVGSHTAFVLSPTGGALETLATETQRCLTQFSDVVREATGLMRLQVVDVGEIAIVEESQQHYAVPITIAWAYQETWKVSQEALRLMGASIRSARTPD